MNQNAIVEDTTTENIIIVNPIVDNTLHINDAVLLDIEVTEAFLIGIEQQKCTILNFCINCIISFLCVSFVMFMIFIILGGLGLFFNYT
jgi:hypothetical protein